MSRTANLMLKTSKFSAHTHEKIWHSQIFFKIRFSLRASQFLTTRGLPIYLFSECIKQGTKKNWHRRKMSSELYYCERKVHYYASEPRKSKFSPKGLKFLMISRQFTFGQQFLVISPNSRSNSKSSQLENVTQIKLIFIHVAGFLS